MMRAITCGVVLLALAFGAAGGVWAQGAAQVGVTATAIKIGLVGPFTGKLADWGTQRYGALMVFDDVNEAGGIHGRKIEVVQLDSACDSARMVAAVKKGIFEDRVFAFFGGVCSPVVLAAKDVVIENKVPWMIPSSSADSIIQPYNRYLFRTAASSTGQAASIAEFIRAQSFRRPAALYSRDSYGEPIREAVVKQLASRGLSFAVEEGFQTGDTDFVPQLLKVRGANPDVVLLIGYLREQGIQVRQAHELGIKAALVATASATPAIKEIVPREALAGLYVITSLQGAEESPKFRWFHDKLRKRFPDVARQPGQPNWHVFSAYGAAQLFVDALEKAGKELTRERLVETLETYRDYDTGIHAVPITFSSTDHEGMKGSGFLQYNERLERIFIRAVSYK
jgi:branched-chain amino acid transport system substrate-binding protein